VHVEKETLTWCGLIDGGPTLPIIRVHKRMLLCSASSSRPQPEVSTLMCRYQPRPISLHLDVWVLSYKLNVLRPFRGYLLNRTPFGLISPCDLDKKPLCCLL